MTAEIVDRVLRSSRYRDVDRSLLSRLAAEELPRARNTDDAVKRVKRRLHQAVGAFRGERRTDALGPIRAAWNGDMADQTFRATCAEGLRTHASSRERIHHVDTFYSGIWRHTGLPARVLDIGCGLNPLALPWMGIGDASYLATDVDQRPLEIVRGFLDLVGQPGETRATDAVNEQPSEEADVALLLKLVTTLDRQDAGAASRLLDALRVGHAVVSFAARTLGGQRKGMERTYRERVERLADECPRVIGVAEASVPNELVFVLTLDG